MMEQLQKMNLVELNFQELEIVNGGDDSVAHDVGYAIGYGIAIVSAVAAGPFVALMAWGYFIREH